MDEEKINDVYYKYMSDLAEIDELKAIYMVKKKNLEIEKEVSTFIYRQESERLLDFENTYGESEELFLIKNDIGTFYEEDGAEFRKRESMLEEEYKDLIKRKQKIEEDYRNLMLCEDAGGKYE